MKVGDVFVRMALDNRDYRAGLAREEGYTRQRAMTLGSIFSKGFSVAMGIGLVHGFKTVGGLLTDLITTAAKTETYDVAMQAVARSSGYPIPMLQQQRKEVMALGIAEQEATQMLTRFMQAQLDTADAAKIARIAQDAGTVASMNSSEATAQITEAIAKLRPELLTAFGFTRNLNDIYKDYAVTVGKTATQLSEVEKKQAMLNYIFREGEKIAGAYESAMGTVGKKMGSLEKLELSKKLMQELKTALARPLLLPAFGYWVDAMHNAFERAKTWIEANQATLISWGQTAKNVVAGIVRGVQWITNAFIKNWGAIRFAATAFLSYLVLARAINIARTAALAFSITLSVLRGQSVITSGVLGVLSTVVQTYRLQMALAPVATNIFTASLYSLQAGIYAVWTALGPVGWAILAISAAIAGGSYLWSKYSSSVRAANEAARQAYMQKMAEKQKAAAKAAMEAVKGETSLADAIEKAGKAAGKSLQSFDEVHTLQQDMGGLDDMPDLDMPGLDIPELGLPDMGDLLGGFGAGLEEVKGTFKGFLQWIWGYVTDWFKDWNWWEILLFCLGPAFQIGLLIYKNWDKIVAWVKETLGPLFAPIGEAWGRFVAWAGGIWDGVKAKWEDLKNKAGEIWTNIKTTIKTKWDELKTGAKAIWENIKTEISTRWEALKTGAETIWNNIKTGIITKWEDLKAFATNIWETIKSTVLEKWEDLKNKAGEIWTNIKTTIKTKWDELKTGAKAIWENIKTEISTRWEALKTGAETIWNNIKTGIITKWEDLKAFATNIWETIKSTVLEKWEALKTGAGTAWTTMTTTITGWVTTARDKVLEVWENIKKKLSDTWESIKETAGKVWENIWRTIKGWIDDIKNLFNFSWSLPPIKVPHLSVSWDTGGYLSKAGQYLGLPGIPKFNVDWYAQGGIFTSPQVIGIGESGPEAVIPLSKGGLWDDMADSVAQAVYSAIRDAIRVSRIEQGGGSQGRERQQEIVLEIDGTRIGRAILPALVSESQRLGGGPIIQLQGG